MRPRPQWTHLLVCLLLVCLPSSAQNSRKVQRMKQQRTELKNQIDANEHLLRSTRRDVRSQLGNLSLLDAQIAEHQQLMDGIQGEADSLQGDIDRLNREIERLEQELEACKTNYRRAMTFVSHQRLRQSRWTYIFMAKDFRTMYRRMRYASEFSKNQKTRGNMIARKETALREKRATLHAAKSEKDRLIAEGRQTRTALDGKKRERQQIIDQLRGKEADLQAGLTRQRREYNNLNARIDRVIQEEIAAAQARQRERERQRRLERERQEREARRNANKTKPATTAKGKKTGKTTTKTTKKTGKTTAPKTTAPKFREPDTQDRQLSNNFAANRGRLPAPISGSFAVTSRFGRYDVQGLSGVTLDNKGVNLTGRAGAQARAIFQGEVSAVVNLGGTYTVIIRHGDYYSVYSHLQNVGVRRGATVSTGQTLGAVAGDGAGNTMLHFQLRHNTEKLNPLQWIVH